MASRVGVLTPPTAAPLATTDSSARWRVIWTTPAWHDVEEAARFIARDSPRYAVVLQRQAQAAARSLQQFARRGRIVRERDDERLRELVVGKSYRLIYKLVADDAVHIITLFMVHAIWMHFFNVKIVSNMLVSVVSVRETSAAPSTSNTPPMPPRRPALSRAPARSVGA